MQNAKTLDNHTKPKRILALGDAGSGKTTQIVTLPRPCYVMFFDPNGANSIQGQDIDYDEWLPTNLPMGVATLSKGGKRDIPADAEGSSVYLDWERDFDSKIESKFFDPYASICLDSCTTFLDLIMDRVLTLNGRPGQWPHQDDYGPQMMAFTSVMRTLTKMNKTIYVTGHLKTDKDELLGKIIRLPLVTGQLREKLPILFSDVFVFGVETDIKTGTPRYIMQTTPDAITPRVRSSIKGIAPREDVTLDWSKDTTKQGLGLILQLEKEGKL